MVKKFDVTKHILVPKHVKATEKDKKELFVKHGVSIENLPKIYKSDPAIADLDVQEYDIIKIVRNSPTAGTTTFYRRVVNG